MPTEKDHKKFLHLKKTNKIRYLIHHMDTILPNLTDFESKNVQFLSRSDREVPLSLLYNQGQD